jgi:hypothetical protein
MRLFRREGVRWQGKVHETVGMCGWAGCLKNAIEHESTPDVDTYLGKLIRYSSFEASAQLSSGRCPHWSQRWFGPLRQFARLYFGKLGFLDGPEGFRFCALSALQVWITHQKVIEQMRRVESPLTRADTSESKEYCHGPAIAAA